MWCTNCNLETNELRCPVCGNDTVEDVPTEIFWCKSCLIPIIHFANSSNKGICPICGKKTAYLSSDLRPVFPEERILISVLLNKEPKNFMNRSIWATNNRYYIDGKSFAVPSKIFAEADTEKISKKIHELSDKADYSFFEKNINLFMQANQHRLSYLKDESFNFVRHAAEKFNEENIVISFSGGKDSTVTADVVIKALSNPSLVHIFGNTTLEFPSTIE